MITWSVLYCTKLYYTFLYCTILYCTVLRCTILYCTELNWCPVCDTNEHVLTPHFIQRLQRTHCVACSQRRRWPVIGPLAHRTAWMRMSILLPPACYCLWRYRTFLRNYKLQEENLLRSTSWTARQTKRLLLFKNLFGQLYLTKYHYWFRVVICAIRLIPPRTTCWCYCVPFKRTFCALFLVHSYRIRDHKLSIFYEFWMVVWESILVFHEGY